MSIDDEAVPWPAHEAIERGEDPKEQSAQFKLARLLAEHDHIHSVHHQMVVAGRVLAFLPRIVAWTEAEKPAAAPAELLRQQRTARLSPEDHAIERAHYHRVGLAEAMAELAAMGSPHVDRFDPDAREQDREDDRAREARQDQAAADAGVQMGAAS